MKTYHIQCKILGDTTEIEDFLKENEIEFNKKITVCQEKEIKKKGIYILQF